MDFRISRSRVDGLSGDDFLWAVIEPTWPDAAVQDELQHIALATPGQRAVYVVTLFIREVDNGGLHQFFYNSSGRYVEEVVKGLRLLSAHEEANVLEQSFAIFPRGRVPLDWRDRRQLLGNVPKDQLAAKLSPLEDKLYGEDRFSRYFHAYIEAHPEEFFVD